MFGSAVCVKHLSLVLLLVAGTALPAENEKLPVPDEAARAKAWATIQDVFDADTTVAELLKNAGNVRKNPAAYWALLDMAGTKAAVEELQVKETPQAWIALADTWWALEEEPFNLRAATWYKKALDDPRTTGLAAVKAERRWKEAQEVGKRIPEAPSPRPPNQDEEIRRFLMAGIWRCKWDDGSGASDFGFEPDGTITTYWQGEKTSGSYAVEDGQIKGTWGSASLQVRIDGVRLYAERTHLRDSSKSKRGVATLLRRK